MCSKQNLLLCAPFALLWLILLNELRGEWTVNPQYGYGWVVPLLALGLLLRRWSDRSPLGLAPPASRLTALNLQPSFPVLPRPGLLCLFIVCAAALLPLRLLLEASPGWRTLNLLLALCTIGLSLGAVYLTSGRGRTLHLAFPICFILVAVPWPYSLELPLIQGLTQASARLVVEILGLLDVPALQHGNLLEVSTGTVGIDEACSGIRSFQSSLMVSLCLGEFYRLRLKRRLLLVPLGFLTAFGFNVCRTGLLAWLAARKGLGAVAQYHDPAGITILLACTATLWFWAWLLHHREQKANPRSLKAITSGRLPEPGQLSAVLSTLATTPPSIGGAPAAAGAPVRACRSASPAVCRLAFGLLVWLFLLELGVESWYRYHESKYPKSAEWTLAWPPNEPGFREVAIPEVDRELLKFNQAHAGVWVSEAGYSWQLYYFRWQPGKLAATSAWGHTPDVCLTAAGKALRPLGDNRCPMRIRSLLMPFRRYEYEENGQRVYVFYCLWEERAPGSYFESEPPYGLLEGRLRHVLEGRRNRGQRSLEILVAGPPNAKVAQPAVETELRKLLEVTGDAPRPRKSTAPSSPAKAKPGAVAQTL